MRSSKYQTTGHPVTSAQRISWWTFGVVRSLSQLLIVRRDTPNARAIWSGVTSENSLVWFSRPPSVFLRLCMGGTLPPSGAARKDSGESGRKFPEGR